jgi:hypothetical protein
LKSNLVGNIELNEARVIREKIQNRWDKLGFTEGLQGYLKENMATLFENEARHLIYEATDAGNSGSFETVVFPIVRRIFSKLLANDIVSVQAMNLPIGKLFFIIPVTSQRRWETAEGGEVDPMNPENGDTGSHYGTMGYTRTNKNWDGTSNNKYVNRYYMPDEVINEIQDQPNNDPSLLKPAVVQYMKKSLYDLFYNDFLFDNSKGKVTIKADGGITPGYLNPVGEFVQATDEKPFVYTDDSIRNIMVELSGFTTFNYGKLTGPDGNEMDTEEFVASLKVICNTEIASTDGTAAFKQYEAIPFRVVTQQYGKGIATMTTDTGGVNTGKMLLELNLAKPVTVQGKTIDGFIGIDKSQYATITGGLKIVWAQYDSLELETEIGEVSFKLDSITVSVVERKLRATWSPELAQDVSAFHNIDAEAELTSILSEQIGAEIDREILRDLRKEAPWQLDWDYNGWRRMGGFSTNYTQKDWNQMLMTRINQISAQVQKSTLRGGVNFIVVSSEVGAVLYDLEYFHVTDASAEQDVYNMGIERIGSLNGRYQVYVDPYSPSWSIILGHKGKSLLDTGYIYAPYVPMQLTPTVINYNNFAPVKGIATRYAKKCVNNRFYGHIRVTGLQTWNTNELR